MKKSVKIMLIVALAFVGTGILCLCMAFAFGGYNPVNNAVEDSDYKRVTATFDEVDALKIVGLSDNVRLVASESNEVKVTYSENKSFGYSVSLEGKRLIIEYKDLRSWYEFFGFFSLKFNDLIVELPEKVLNELQVNTASGSIEAMNIMSKKTDVSTVSGEIQIGGDTGELKVSSTGGDILLSSLRFEKLAEVWSTGGDIYVNNMWGEELKASSVSGELELESLHLQDVRFKTTSGDIEGDSLELSSLDVESVSGEIQLSRAVCTRDMTVKTTSGDIELTEADADEYELSSTSGSINARILTPKFYNASSTSGKISVPAMDKNCEGAMNLKTTSGDITVTLTSP